MKFGFNTLLWLVTLLLVACGGGDSGSGGGGATTIPANIAGNYTGNWSGSGTNAAGTFTCEGTFNLSISQAGTTLVVTFNLQSTGGTAAGECTDAFSFSGGGTYNASSGELNIESEQGSESAFLNGTASEAMATITINGTWSVLDTASGDVVSSGTWNATSTEM